MVNVSWQVAIGSTSALRDLAGNTAEPLLACVSSEGPPPVDKMTFEPFGTSVETVIEVLNGALSEFTRSPLGEGTPLSRSVDGVVMAHVGGTGPVGSLESPDVSEGSEVPTPLVGVAPVVSDGSWVSVAVSVTPVSLVGESLVGESLVGVSLVLGALLGSDDPVVPVEG